MHSGISSLKLILILIARMGVCLTHVATKCLSFVKISIANGAQVLLLPALVEICDILFIGSGYFLGFFLKIIG